MRCDCNIAAHRSKVVLSDLPALFYKRRNDTAVVGPFLHTSFLEKSVVQELLDTPFTYAEWKKEVELRECAVQQGRTVEEVKDGLTLARATYKTPGKRGPIKRWTDSIDAETEAYNQLRKVPRLTQSFETDEGWSDDEGWRNFDEWEQNQELVKLKPILKAFAAKIDAQAELAMIQSTRNSASEEMHRQEHEEVEKIVAALRLDLNLLRGFVGDQKSLEGVEGDTLGAIVAQLDGMIKLAGIQFLGNANGVALGRNEVAPVLQGFANTIAQFADRLTQLESGGNSNFFGGGGVVQRG